MGNKIATFTEQQLDDYQVSFTLKSLNQSEKLNFHNFSIAGLYIFHAKRNIKVRHFINFLKEIKKRNT